MLVQSDHRPPPDRRPLKRVPALVLWGAVAALVLTALGGWLVSSQTARDGDEKLTASSKVTGSLSLPWPAGGQASVVDTGSGRSGTSGEQKAVPIASVTKVMTAYVILMNHPLQEGESGPLITVDQKAQDESGSRDESTVYVAAGQEFTQRQLLEMLLLPSGNNIARLLARWDAGSEQAFAAKMNRAAADLRMTRTNYTGASGFEPTNKSTSNDQLRLARAVMRDPVFRTIVASREVTIGGTTGTIANTNKLLGTEGIIGIKTGSSTPAGGALMWAAETGREAGSGLILGVVLHQRPNTTPAQGLQAAFDTTERLAATARREAGAAVQGDRRQASLALHGDTR
ncbi:D-alanyl-D-alanine carboxypeptidase family protein [Streptomyces albipurpureus]|uniref:D-alanyl-D-alanine carboxypeptidase n=1 Tax=Streptomyces albipurpureus TaxID=2897419 RepID=A0ABT0UK47_9ACTN|nr:D-alanyl-D-alanine carboxypeptidase [Streptomyces sp. CWNU-1]MCM2388830.1 D-alanyl-D-alanine carboxypeptidase [Streptomyces sp. CWNU-1]